MTITTASAYVVLSTTVTLAWKPCFSWILDEVVVASLLLFALFEDVFLSSVDTDFVFTCICVWWADSVSLSVALFVGFSSEAFDASTSASLLVDVEGKILWAEAGV